MNKATAMRMLHAKLCQIEDDKKWVHLSLSMSACVFLFVS